MRIFENLLYIISYVFLIQFIYYNGESSFGGFAAMIPAGLACALNCFCIKYEETPCNASMQLVTKVLVVLR